MNKQSVLHAVKAIVYRNMRFIVTGMFALLIALIGFSAGPVAVSNAPETIQTPMAVFNVRADAVQACGNDAVMMASGQYGCPTKTPRPTSTPSVKTATPKSTATLPPPVTLVPSETPIVKTPVKTVVVTNTPAVEHENYNFAIVLNYCLAGMPEGYVGATVEAVKNNNGRTGQIESARIENQNVTAGKYVYFDLNQWRGKRLNAWVHFYGANNAENSQDVPVNDPKCSSTQTPEPSKTPAPSLTPTATQEIEKSALGFGLKEECTTGCECEELRGIRAELHEMNQLKKTEISLMQPKVVAAQETTSGFPWLVIFFALFCAGCGALAMYFLNKERAKQVQKPPVQ